MGKHRGSMIGQRDKEEGALKESKTILATMRRRRISIILMAALGALVILGVGVAVGTLKFSVGELWPALGAASPNLLANQIVHNVRLPRLLTGMLAGMNLAVAGGLLQGILRNPLAAPHVIGVNAGAGLVAVAVMLLAPGRIEFIPLGAFLGALFATMLVYGLSALSGASTTIQIVLAGVAVSALLNAVTSGMMFLHGDQLEITYGWLLGSLSGRSWRYFHLLWPYSLAGLASAIFLGPKINLFSLGDEVGGSLGLSVKAYRIVTLITASILAGSAVSVAGTIGFIGLVGPHLARLLVGNDYRYTIILSALLGGILLTVSDTLARSVFQPVELAVGIVTAVCGAPFFLFLLYRKGKQG